MSTIEHTPHTTDASATASRDVGGTDALIAVTATVVSGYCLWAGSGLARFGNDAGAETVFVSLMVLLAAVAAASAVWLWRRALVEPRPRPAGVDGPSWWSYPMLAVIAVSLAAPTLSFPDGVDQTFFLVSLIALQALGHDSRWARQRRAAATQTQASALLPGEDETDRLLRVFPTAHVTSLTDEGVVHVGLDWDGDTPGESGYVTRDFPTMHAALTYACDEAHVIEVRFDGGEAFALVRDEVSRACWERIHQREAALHGVQPTPHWITPAEALARG